MVARGAASGASKPLGTDGDNDQSPGGATAPPAAVAPPGLGEWIDADQGFRCAPPLATGGRPSGAKKTTMRGTNVFAPSHPITRRAVLRVGGAGLLGLSFPQMLAAASSPKAKAKATAKAVIFLHQ